MRRWTIFACFALALAGCREEGLEAELRRMPERTPTTTVRASVALTAKSGEGWMAQSLQTSPQQVVPPPR